MDILLKIFMILILFFFIYMWNRFIIKNIIKLLIGFHKKYNTNNLNKQPIKFVVENEKNIYKLASGFYWLGVVIISIGILTDE